MRENVDLAKGHIKGDKVAADAKWANIVSSLNSAGPPIKDVAGWKK